MNDLPTTDPDAAEAHLLGGRYIDVAGDEVNCFACQVSGPYSSADGGVVYLAPEARHNHERSPYPRSEQLQLWDEEAR